MKFRKKPVVTSSNAEETTYFRTFLKGALQNENKFG